MKDILIVLAMQQEGQGLFESKGVSVIYTGLGKVNACSREHGGERQLLIVEVVVMI